MIVELQIGSAQTSQHSVPLRFTTHSQAARAMARATRAEIEEAWGLTGTVRPRRWCPCHGLRASSVSPTPLPQLPPTPTPTPTPPPTAPNASMKGDRSQGTPTCTRPCPPGTRSASGSCCCCGRTPCTTARVSGSRRCTLPWPERPERWSKCCARPGPTPTHART